MSKLLSGLHGVLCLMDDVLVFGGDTKEWFMGMVNQLGKFLRTWQTSLTPYDNSSARNQRGCAVLTKIEHSQRSKQNW